MSERKCLHGMVGCCMAGEHQSWECHTPAMYEAAVAAINDNCHSDLPPRDGPNLTRIKDVELRCAELERLLGITYSALCQQGLKYKYPDISAEVEKAIYPRQALSGDGAKEGK